MNLFHRVLIQEQAIAADGIATFDLGTNPLSVVLLCLRPLNDTAGTTDFATYQRVMSAVDRLTILHRGGSIVSGSGLDLMFLNYFRHNIQPLEANPDDADNERRCVVLPILMGRKAYSPRSCFPATVRGELVLECLFDIADTAFDGLRISVETIELIGARPSEFERKTTTSQTFAAVGDNDIFLPVGNLVRGLLCFGTTGFTGATPAPTLGRLSTWLDGRQAGYSSTDFEVALGLHNLLGRTPKADDHTHRVAADAASAVQETFSLVEFGANAGNFCYLNFDPWEDDELSVNTAGATQWFLRADAEAANAARVLEVEKIAI